MELKSLGIIFFKSLLCIKYVLSNNKMCFSLVEILQNKFDQYYFACHQIIFIRLL